MQDLLWHTLAGTRGGPMRARIVWSIHLIPRNAHQLAQLLKVDYSTIQHHIAFLIEHGIVETVPGSRKYGQGYRPTAMTRAHWDALNPIWDGFRTNLGKHT